MTRFVKGATTVQFNQDPVRPYSIEQALSQLLGKDSAGNDYVYQKSLLKGARYRLTFPRLTDAVHDALRAFMVDDIDGARESFTWYDHDDTARTVRIFSGAFSADNIGPNQWRVEIEILEDTVA